MNILANSGVLYANKRSLTTHNTHTSQHSRMPNPQPNNLQNSITDSRSHRECECVCVVAFTDVCGEAFSVWCILNNELTLTAERRPRDQHSQRWCENAQNMQICSVTICLWLCDCVYYICIWNILSFSRGKTRAHSVDVMLVLAKIQPVMMWVRKCELFLHKLNKTHTHITHIYT